MKKALCALLTLCMMLTTTCSLAESVEAQLVQIIQNALEGEELTYEYNEENIYFTLSFPLNSTLDVVDIAIFPYDDMVSVVVTSPLSVAEECFEPAAVFTTLANNQMYYCQFRVDREYGLVQCRSCNVVERVLPAEEEIVTLLYMPIIAMDDYGDGIAAVCQDGADPYEAFNACQAVIDSQGE